MDGPLNTNYTKGVGFTPGTGSDVYIEPAAEYVNGEYVVYTDARKLQFPNARTDITTYDCSSPELGQALEAAARILGENGAGRESRTELSAQFAALVADGKSPKFQTEANYISETAQCHNPNALPLHLRLPQRTAINRSSHFDLTGTAGTEYEIRILDATANEVNRLRGVLSEDLFATPEFLTPSQPGIYTVELWIGQNRVGSHTMRVETSLPQSFEELQENWLPKEAPVIHESLASSKLKCR